MSEPSLLDLKRGKVMKTIKDTPTGVDSPGTIVERMEQEWPEMTQEFKRLQRE